MGGVVMNTKIEELREQATAAFARFKAASELRLVELATHDRLMAELRVAEAELAAAPEPAPHAEFPEVRTERRPKSRR